MDTDTLLHPRIRDRELLDEFLEALTERIPDIEHDISRLKRTPGDKVLISNLFRALHTIKGDAALCEVDLGVMIAHPMESLLQRMRIGEIGFSELLAEAMLLALDRLEIATKAIAAGRPIDQMQLVELVGGFEDMAGAAAGELDAKAALLIESVSGFRAINAPHLAKSPASAITQTPVSVTSDLHFFRSLALRYEARSPLFNGRSERQLNLALETNEVAGKPINPFQLEAAVYMHDVGMLFLPEPLWLKAVKLSDEEKRQLQDHPGIGAGLLARMQGWEAAAEMVLQHHERQDGGGYPRALTSDQICPGAKLLAIIDTFESVTLKHNQRGAGRSLLRAIAEINACDDQFAPEWIASFNTVIRRMVEG
jgi:HPt (histidine-containing phosphotransfer) domain-containing protein